MNNWKKYTSQIGTWLRALLPVLFQKAKRLMDIAVDITADYGVVLDIHYYTTNDINNPPFSRSPFVRSVLEEGVRI